MRIRKCGTFVDTHQGRQQKRPLKWTLIYNSYDNSALFYNTLSLMALVCVHLGFPSPF